MLQIATVAAWALLATSQVAAQDNDDYAFTIGSGAACASGGKVIGIAISASSSLTDDQFVAAQFQARHPCSCMSTPFRKCPIPRVSHLANLKDMRSTETNVLQHEARAAT